MAVRTIEEYIAGLDDEGKYVVDVFIGFMAREFPEVQPRISYSMPMWLAHDKMDQGYVAISAAKNHFSIHLSDEELVADIAQEMAGCKSGKRCINIQYGDVISLLIMEEYVREFFASLK